MKKLIYLSIVALMTLGVCTLSSCGKDDEPTNKTDTEKFEPTLKSVYELKLGKDFFKVVSKVDIYYYDGSETLKTETLTSGTSWSKTITASSFPAKFGVKAVATPRNASDIADGTYDLKSSLWFKVVKATSVNSEKSKTNASEWLSGYDYDNQVYTYTKEQLSTLDSEDWSAGGWYEVYDSSFNETTSGRW